MLTWSDQFATGSALVDTQHRMLIDKINLLEQMLGGPPPPRSQTAATARAALAEVAG